MILERAELTATVLEHVSPIVDSLNGAVAEAIEAAEARCHGFAHREYPHMRPMFVRAAVREHLRVSGLAAGWAVAGNSRQMGQLYLEKAGVMRLQLLKAAVLNPGGVPHAGSNARRRAQWSQPPLDGVGLKAPEKFLLIWDYLDVYDRMNGYSLRLAHPNSPGRVGVNVPCDFMVDVPSRESMEASLKAFETAEEVDFFGVRLDASDLRGEVG